MKIFKILLGILFITGILYLILIYPISSSLNACLKRDAIQLTELTKKSNLENWDIKDKCENYGKLRSELYSCSYRATEKTIEYPMLVNYIIYQFTSNMLNTSSQLMAEHNTNCTNYPETQIFPGK